MEYGLIGERLGHSFSKEIHESLGCYSYELVEVTPDELGPFMRARAFAGMNVTIPYKEAIIPYLDELSESARRIGSVNTVVNRNGTLFGDNTDKGGLEALVQRAGLHLTGKTVLIAGTGGTSKTAQAVADSLGAARVERLSRTGRESAFTYERAYEELNTAEVLVNTTPVGMFPHASETPVALERLPHLEGVIDVVYNPRLTRLVREARERGIRAEGGLYMLVVQALLSAELFVGEPFDEQRAESIFNALSA